MTYSNLMYFTADWLKLLAEVLTQLQPQEDTSDMYSLVFSGQHEVHVSCPILSACWKLIFRLP